MGQVTLKISINEDENAVGLILEGRVAGPWVEELDRAWKQISPKLNGKHFWLDLRNVTYSDSNGKRVLREIFGHTQGELLTSSAWSQHLADEIRNTQFSSAQAEV